MGIDKLLGQPDRILDWHSSMERSKRIGSRFLPQKQLRSEGRQLRGLHITRYLVLLPKQDNKNQVKRSGDIQDTTLRTESLNN